MTPDELRRMDNDLCIIFEKGIKPVKANKYYYFKHKKVADTMRRLEISHNDIGEIQRGNWRKFNPYNPWTEDKSEKEAENLKVESLDDLFDDEPKKEETKKEPIKVANANEQTAKPLPDFQEIDDIFGDEPMSQEKEEPKVQDEEDTYDLQKELEAKFDELFGPIDD